MSLVIDKSEPFTAFLFFRRDSQRAADALMNALKHANGTLTQEQMSEFIRKLGSGELGFRFSRVNFYRKVLRTFLDLGFIEKTPQHAYGTTRGIDVYRVIFQDIPARRPPNPSFWNIAYQTCEWWNELFAVGAGERRRTD